MEKNPFNHSGGSAAAPSTQTYSTQELAEIYLKSRPDFLGLDLEEVTCNWDANYIYEFLYHLNDVGLFDGLIKWFVICWRSKHHLFDTYDRANNNELNSACSEFESRMIHIKNLVLDRIKSEREEKEVYAELMVGYHQSKTEVQPVQSKTEVQPVQSKTEAPPVQSTTETASVQSTESTGTTTNPPKFNPNTETSDAYHIELSSLPKDVRDKVVVSQKVFDVFVHQLNEDLWLTVTKSKSTLCGCLFFLSNYYNITSRNTTAPEFDSLLHQVVVALYGKGSLTSSIRRREETNEKNIHRSYLCYCCADSSKSMEQEIYRLKNDCKILLDGFAPVLEMMEAEKRAEEEAHQTSTAA